MSPDDVAAVLRADPSGTGVFSDFDGTLARIVEDPAEAAPVEGAVDALAALVPVYALVGVLSGRPGAFLLEHLGGRGLTLSGLYGMEVVVDGAVRPVEEVEDWLPVVRDAVANARTALDRRLLVEDKGLSFTVHYRKAPDLAEVAREWATATASSTGLVAREARRSFELCPPLSRDKGTVLADLARGLGTVCFAGDDRGDLTAFDALDALEAEGAAAYRVGVASPEAPGELLERADLVLQSPDAVVDFFRSLA
jgi:trehalose 6-phosphate phosphatase